MLPFCPPVSIKGDTPTLAPYMILRRVSLVVNVINRDLKCNKPVLHFRPDIEASRLIKAPKCSKGGRCKRGIILMEN